MITSHELARIRRQMHRRIRVILAQRRTTADQRAAGQGEAPAGGPTPPHRR